MKLELPSTVASRQDLQTLILEIRQYGRWATQAGLKQRVSKSPPPAQPAISEAATALMQRLPADKPDSLAQLIRDLESLAASAPSISITLAAPAPGSLRKSLLDWCRQNIAPDVLVDFEYNSTILGGMVVRFGSHVHDWSFRRQILAAIGKFPEVMRNV